MVARQLQLPAYTSPVLAAPGQLRYVFAQPGSTAFAAHPPDHHPDLLTTLCTGLVTVIKD